jgi:hypothetical protein
MFQDLPKHFFNGELKSKETMRTKETEKKKKAFPIMNLAFNTWFIL